MTDNNKPVEVIQADRDAVIAWLSNPSLTIDEAFARHRLNTTVPDEVVKALEAPSHDWWGLKIARMTDADFADLCARFGDNTGFDQYSYTIKRANLRAILSELRTVRTALQTIKGNGQ